MNEPAASQQPQDEIPFQRLHPLSIVLKSLSMLGQNFVAIIVLHFSLFDQDYFYSLLAALGLTALVVGVTTLIWSRFTYQVTSREIRIKSGLLNRNNRSIPFDRIQDVSIEQKLLGRLLGLATVGLETGSGGGEDGQLDALSRADAEFLRDTLRDYKAGVPGDASSASDVPMAEEKPPLFAMDNRRILIAGLFNFSFVLLAIFGAIAQNLDFLLPDDIFDPRYWLEALPEREMIDNINAWWRIAGVLGAILSLITIGLVSGIVRTFVREYRFRLDRIERGQPGFRRQRGLFTLTDMVMPIHRVQAAILQTGPVRQRFGWYHLKFTSLAGDGGGETDHSAAPCARLPEIDPILDQCGIRPPPPDAEFLPVHSAHWWRHAILGFLALAAISLGNGYLVHGGLFAILLLALPISLLFYLNWRHHRYVLDRDHLYVWTGWWSRKLTLVRLHKIQSVDIGQSPLDHPLDLATITIGIAGGSAMAPLRISALDYSDAMVLRDRLLASHKHA